MRKVLIALGLALGLVLVPSVAVSAGKSGVQGPGYTLPSNFNTGQVTWMKVPRSPWDGDHHTKYVECLVIAGFDGTDALSCNWTQYNG